MEVELNWRRFALIALIASLLVGGAYILWPRLQSNIQANTDMEAIKATLVPGQKIVANKLNINFENQSSWKVEGIETCLPKLSAWIGERYPLQTLTIMITDTVSPDMAISVQQSRETEPDALVTGKYEETENQGLTLTIAVKEGKPGSTNLDVAVTVEAAALVYDYFRPRTQEYLKSQKDGLKQFQPLIRKEDGQWISDCLHLTR